MNNSKVIKRNVSVIQFSDGSGLYQICSIRKKKILIEADIKSNSFWIFKMCLDCISVLVL